LKIAIPDYSEIIINGNDPQLTLSSKRVKPSVSSYHLVC